MAVSIEDLAEKTGNTRATVIANALNDANARYLSENKSPSRKVNELDNRGSHFYLAMYWAAALATQTVDAELATQFTSVADALAENEQAIVAELLAAQGAAVDIGGYFHPDESKATAAMRPSLLLNNIIDSI